jgi:hypothetical protein
MWVMDNGAEPKASFWTTTTISIVGSVSALLFLMMTFVAYKVYRKKEGGKSIHFKTGINGNHPFTQQV